MSKRSASTGERTPKKSVAAEAAVVAAVAAPAEPTLHRTALPPANETIVMSDGDESDVMLFPSDSDGNDGDEPKKAATKAKKTKKAAKKKGVSDAIHVGSFQAADSESDSSEDEAVLNRVGDIPLEWYKDEEHIGYDIEGRRLKRSERSALEKLLDATDDPNAFRTIMDALHDEKKVLSNDDLELIFNLQRNRTPNAAYNMYSDYSVGNVVFDPLNHPLARGTGPSKKKFVPALHEMKVISKMVRRLLKEKERRRERGEPSDDEKEKEKDKDPDEVYDLWVDDANALQNMDTKTKFKYYNRIPKPERAPPGTYESYRPPPEYVPSEAAKKRHLALRRIDRKEHFLPQAFGSLRHVPFYHHFIQDQYQRCLDLCAFPRWQRTRLVVDPSKLLPELPDPKTLRPYPERLAFLYKGHTATVRSIHVSPNGQYLATGCDDHLVRIFETATGRLMKRYDVGGPVEQVEWCPNRALNLLAVAVDYALIFIVPTFAAHTAISDHTIRVLKAPGLTAEASDAHVAGGSVGTAGRGITQATRDLDEEAYEGARDLHDDQEREKRADFVDATAKERQAGIVLKVVMHARVKRFTWQAKGDYLCALCPKDHVKYRQTVMLQLSRRKVFCPFRKFAEIVTDCKFHPSAPQFFLSTTNAVRAYNLMQHKLQKRFKSHGGITTCLDIHPEGDNIIVGDSTNHCSWFDSEFSDKPYKRMRSHKGVVTCVGYHRNTDAYPLFASGSADGQVHVFHGMVYDDYNRNALIVPVKILKHNRQVYSLAWHPTLPWLFTSTQDGTVSCWTE